MCSLHTGTGHLTLLNPQLSTWDSHSSAMPLNSHPSARCLQWTGMPLAAMALSMVVLLFMTPHAPAWLGHLPLAAPLHPLQTMWSPCGNSV